MSALDELRAAAKSRCWCIKLKHLNNRPCGPCAMLVLAERAIAEAQPAPRDFDRKMGGGQYCGLCGSITPAGSFHSCRSKPMPGSPWCITEGCNKTALWCEDHGEEKQPAPQVTVRMQDIVSAVRDGDVQKGVRAMSDEELEEQLDVIEERLDLIGRGVGETEAMVRTIRSIIFGALIGLLLTTLFGCTGFSEAADGLEGTPHKTPYDWCYRACEQGEVLIWKGLCMDCAQPHKKKVRTKECIKWLCSNSVHCLCQKWQWETRIEENK